MQKMAKLKAIISFLLALLVSLSLMMIPTSAAPQDTAGRDNENHGHGDANKEDPCDHLPSPPGVANGIDKMCPAGGTSAGVAKGDFNHDGFADLAIGEPRASISGQAESGDVFVLYGSANGVQTTSPHFSLFSEANLPIISTGAGDHFGSALASGDFNGDGFSDLAIGVPGRTISTPGLFGSTTHAEAGAIVVLYGSANGLNTSGEQYFDLNHLISDTPVNGVMWDQSAFTGAHFGSSLAWGVFNPHAGAASFTDGLAVGIPDIRGLVTGVVQAGAVYMLWGGTALNDFEGRSTIYTEDDGFGSSITNLNGERAWSRFGAAIVAIDDGTGHSNLAVGAPGRTAGGGPVGGIFQSDPCPGQKSCVMGAGVVDVIEQPDQFGGAGTVLGLIDPGVNDHFGASLAAGNFSGGGTFFLAIGIPGRNVTGQANAGMVAVWNNDESQQIKQFQLFDETSFGILPQSGDQFGLALAANDFNGDGRADLAIGVPFKTAVVNRSGSTVILVAAGEVDVLYGSSSGLAGTAQRWNQENLLGVGSAQADAHFGLTLSAWNFGRNQTLNLLGHLTTIVTADLAVGVPNRNVNNITGAGAVNVLYGSFLGGLTNSSPNIFDADKLGLGALKSAHFGSAMY